MKTTYESNIVNKMQSQKCMFVNDGIAGEREQEREQNRDRRI